MYSDQPGYKMVKSGFVDENSNVMPGIVLKPAPRVEIPRYVTQILLQEQKWANQMRQRNVNTGPRQPMAWVPRQPHNFGFQFVPIQYLQPPRVPLSHLNEAACQTSDRSNHESSEVCDQPKLQALPLVMPTCKPQKLSAELKRKNSSQSPSTFGVGLAEIRREKMMPQFKSAAKSVEYQDSTKGLDQTKLKELDEALRDTHLSAHTTMKKPFMYKGFLKDLMQKDGKSIKDKLTDADRQQMEEIKNITLPNPVVHTSFEPKSGICCCNRVKSHVICYFCLYTQEGRKCVKCPQHPLSSYLSDVKICPKCKSSSHLLEKKLD